MLVQLAVIILAVVLVIRALGSRGSHAFSAWAKVGVLLLAAALIVTVLNPELTTGLARLGGIGRGADLLSYATTGTLLFYMVAQYLRAHSTRDGVYRLARRVALLEATAQYAHDGVVRPRTTGDAGRGTQGSDPTLERKRESPELPHS